MPIGGARNRDLNYGGLKKKETKVKKVINSWASCAHKYIKTGAFTGGKNDGIGGMEGATKLLEERVKVRHHPPITFSEFISELQKPSFPEEGSPDPRTWS